MQNYIYRVAESDTYYWDIATLRWVVGTQPGGGTGGAGDASAANQVLQTADLDALVARTPTLGQKTMAGSSPVVLASDQASIPVTNVNLDVALSTRLKPADTLAAVTSITNVVHIDDNAGSLTVDAPVATPVFVRLSDGAAAITTLPVSGPLTDTQLRATPVPISAATLPLPTNAATSALQTTGNTSLANLDVLLSTRLKPADTLAAVTTLGSITSALPAGTNLLGKTGIDQTTPGTTNRVDIGTTGTVAITTGVTAASLAKAEDAIAADGDTGVAVLSTRQDLLASSVNLDGDYAFIKTDRQGRLWVANDIVAQLLQQQLDLLNKMYGEMRVQTHYLQNQLNVNDDAETLRADAYYSPTLQ